METLWNECVNASVWQIDAMFDDDNFQEVSNYPLIPNSSFSSADHSNMGIGWASVLNTHFPRSMSLSSSNSI